MALRFPMLFASRLTHASIRDMLKGSTSIVVGTALIINLIRLFSTITLTRLLDSDDYGVVGIVTSFTYIATMLSDLGFFAFVVRHKDGDDPRFLDEIWTIRLIRSIVLTIILCLAAGHLAAYAGKPFLQTAIMAWSLSLLIEGFSSMAFAHAVRAQTIGRLSLMDIAVAGCQVLLSVAIAVIYPSYWAIIIAVLCSALVQAVLSYALFPGSRRRFRLSRPRSGELWRFSRFIAGSSLLTLLLNQTDKVFLTRFMSLSSFGMYTIASMLTLAPRVLAGSYVQRVLLPAYAAAYREGGTEALRHTFYARRRLLSNLYMFAVGGLGGSAPLVTAILYDPRYAGVATFLSIIAVSAVMLMNNLATDQMLVTVGRTKTTFRINLVRLAWIAAAGFGLFQLTGYMGIVVAVGFVEVPAAIYCWIALWREKILIVREEAMALAIAAAGAGTGFALSHIILAIHTF